MPHDSLWATEYLKMAAAQRRKVAGPDLPDQRATMMARPPGRLGAAAAGMAAGVGAGALLPYGQNYLQGLGGSASLGPIGPRPSRAPTLPPPLLDREETRPPGSDILDGPLHERGLEGLPPAHLPAFREADPLEG